VVSLAAPIERVDGDPRIGQVDAVDAPQKVRANFASYDPDKAIELANRRISMLGRQSRSGRSLSHFQPSDVLEGKK
jgi:hypothetical protein